MKEEKVIKMNISESTFTKKEIDQILSKKTARSGTDGGLDCKSQVIQKVGLAVFELILVEMSDRKTKFGILKIFRIGKAVIKAIEDGIQTWRACNEKPV